MRKRKLNLPLVEVIGLSIALHVIALLIFGGITIFSMIHKEDEQFESPVLEPVEPEKLEYNIKLSEQSQAGSPPPMPSIAVTTLSDVQVPELKVDLAPSRGRGVAGTGQGAGSGSGLGMGGGRPFKTAFFGLETEAQRVLYIVDYSLSMKGDRETLMRRELVKSIKELPIGTEIIVLFFAGPVWIAGEDPKEVEKHWNQGPANNRAHNYTRKKGFKTPKPQWLLLDGDNRNELLRSVRGTELIFGTDWRHPLRMALEVEPKPHAIYFMTDGSVGNEKAVLDEVKKKNRSPTIPIYAIALKQPKAIGSMKKLASDSKGGFKVID